MLGKRSCLLRTTSRRSLLIPSEDTEGEPTTFCNHAQVTEKSPRPALYPPCKVVIGFDIGTEKMSPSNACESPRSVLDVLALLPSQEKQHVVARSPCSGLGSLLTAESGSEVGLEMVTQFQDKEAGVHADVAAGSFQCLHKACSVNMSLSLKSVQYDSKDICWHGNASNSDFMDSDIPSWEKQAPCVLCVGKHLDADSTPWRGKAMFAPSNQDMNPNITAIHISPYQSRAMDFCLKNGFNGGCVDADTFPQYSHAPWQMGLSHVSPRNVLDNEHIKAQAPIWQSGVALYVPGHEGAVDGCKNDHISKWQSEPLSRRKDECTDTQASHRVSSDMESEGISIQKSIFSATSPPSCPHSLITSFSGFLKVCSFCGHALRLGKDIFMYRGDQAFCSAECRYQRIVIDESKEEQGS